MNDIELASRLSFFLWSSIPDDALHGGCASAVRCTRRPCSTQQVTRMLADPRADALVANFAGQWLLLRESEERQTRFAGVGRQPAAVVRA